MNTVNDNLKRKSFRYYNMSDFKINKDDKFVKIIRGKKPPLLIPFFRINNIRATHQKITISYGSVRYRLRVPNKVDYDGTMIENPLMRTYISEMTAVRSILEIKNLT